MFEFFFLFQLKSLQTDKLGIYHKIKNFLVFWESKNIFQLRRLKASTEVELSSKYKGEG